MILIYLRNPWRVFFFCLFVFPDEFLLQSWMSWHRGWGGHLSLIPPRNTRLLTDLNISTLCPAVFVALHFVQVPREKWLVGEQDSNLDCLTTAAVWTWWQGRVSLESPAVELALLLSWWMSSGSPWLEVPDLDWGSWESARLGTLRVGLFGYSRNLPSGKDLASSGCPALALGCPTLGSDMDGLAIVCQEPLV